MYKILFCGLAASLSVCAGTAQEGESRLAPIIVTSDRDAGAPGAVYGLTADDVKGVLADHPAELLNKVPGANIQMNSGQEHLVAIRSPVLTAGAGQGSFLILENGIPTRSPAFGNVNMLLEPVHEFASSVEVVAGPGSARYGSNAVHGLFNFQLPDGSNRPGSLDLNVSASTLDRYRAEIVGRPDAFTGVAALSLQSDQGWRDETGAEQQKAYFSADFGLGGWDGQAWLAVSNLEQETASFIQGDRAYEDRDLAKTNPSPEAYRNAFHTLGAVELTRKAGDWTFQVTPHARVQSMQFSQHFLPNGGVEKNGHNAIGLKTRADYAVSETLTLRGGFDGDIASGFLKEVQPDIYTGNLPAFLFPQGVHYDYQVDTLMAGLWGEVDWEITPKLRLLGGLRGEVHEYDYSTDAPVGINGRFNVVADRTDGFELLTPKLGLIFTATPEAELFINLARGQRAPQASDLYRLQSAQLPGQVRTERLDSLEIGARGKIGDDLLTYEVAAYTAGKDNFYFRDSDRTNVPNGSTQHSGVELSWTARPTSSLAISGNVAWSDQTYTFTRITNSASESITDGNRIDTAPEWLGDVAVTYAPTDALRLTAEAEFIGEYFTNAANTRSYDGHTLINAGASYRFTEALEAYVRVRNLLDETYADRADFAFGNERYFPGEPLNAVFGVRVALGQ